MNERPSTSKETISNVGSPSPRKHRTNSTPLKRNPSEKKMILQQLISPYKTPKVRGDFNSIFARRANLMFFFYLPLFTQVTLDELIQLSEQKRKQKNFMKDTEINIHDTEFNESSTSLSVAGPLRTLTRQVASDHKLDKLEKKVTFARLLNKMSAEINHGSCGEFDVSADADFHIDSIFTRSLFSLF